MSSTIAAGSTLFTMRLLVTLKGKNSDTLIASWAKGPQRRCTIQRNYKEAAGGSVCEGLDV